MTHRIMSSLALGLLLAGLLAGCKVEEDLHLKADGSGEYRVEVSIKKMLGGVSELREKMIASGLEIVAERQTLDSDVLVARRSFRYLEELAELDGSLRLEKRGLLSRAYHLNLTIEDVRGKGVERVLRVHLPVGVEEASGGRIEGRSVSWESSAGGDLEIVASGLVVPGGDVALYGAAGALLVGLLVPVVRRRRRATSRASAPLARCPSCGVAAEPPAAFCTSCGTAFSPGEGAEEAT
jgi:hypothetical protein